MREGGTVRRGDQKLKKKQTNNEALFIKIT